MRRQLSARAGRERRVVGHAWRGLERGPRRGAKLITLLPPLPLPPMMMMMVMMAAALPVMSLMTLPASLPSRAVPRRVALLLTPPLALIVRLPWLHHRTAMLSPWATSPPPCRSLPCSLSKHPPAGANRASRSATCGATHAAVCGPEPRPCLARYRPEGGRGTPGGVHQ